MHFLKDLKARWLGVTVAAVVLALGYWMSHPGDASRANEERSESGLDLPFQLTEVAAQIGLKHRHETFRSAAGQSTNVEPFVSSNTAAVAVVDYDNDGYADIFVNNAKWGGHNTLFHNNGDGTFTDVTEKAGLAETCAFPCIGGYFFDYDNDGFKDLLVVGGTPRLFHNNGNGTFTDSTAKMNLKVPPGLGLMVPAVLDYDQDGYLDLVFSREWGNDFMSLKVDFMPNNFTNATNGLGVMVFRNLKGKGFERVDDNLGFNHVGFGRAVGTYDIRGTGRPDVYFANDFAPDHLYFNEGGGKFRDVSASILTENFSRNGMNAEFADLDNDGHPVIFVSHIFEGGLRPAGNVMWKWLGGDHFRDVSRERGVKRCGWAWGAKFVDLDNDGNLDIVVGNGFISANPQKNYWYALTVLAGADRQVLLNPANWPPIRDSSISGYQRACVFWNDGSGHFKNVVASTGMADDLSDERGIAVIDEKNDGSQSLVIANQNQPLKFYRVTQKNRNQWIGFKLVGTNSNRDAFGSELSLELEDGKVMTRQLQTMNAYGSQSDDRMHFGLGARPLIKMVHVQWPSGLKQDWPGSQFALNQYHKLVEPKLNEKSAL